MSSCWILSGVPRVGPWMRTCRACSVYSLLIRPNYSASEIRPSSIFQDGLKPLKFCLDKATFPHLQTRSRRARDLLPVSFSAFFLSLLDFANNENTPTKSSVWCVSHLQSSATPPYRNSGKARRFFTRNSVQPRSQHSPVATTH